MLFLWSDILNYKKGDFMSKNQQSSLGYLFFLAGKNKFLLLISAIFSILSSLCSFIPFLMVYNVLDLVFTDTVKTQLVIKHGKIAALAVIGKFLFLIISGIFLILEPLIHFIIFEVL